MTGFKPVEVWPVDSFAEAVSIVFGGMAKLGPGDDASTRQALHMLPRRHFTTVVDAGCGTGRQTLVLARELGVAIHALDLHQPFLDELQRRAAAQGLAHLVRPQPLDMAALASQFTGVDLLWSEGAAYNLGFAPALAVWAPALRPGGFAVVSECSWLTDDPPANARAFWNAAYPSMATVNANLAAAEQAGFRAVGAFTLPPEAWVEDFHEILGPRARGLVDHPNESVRAFATEILAEIDLFATAHGSYGYVFYLLERR